MKSNEVQVAKRKNIKNDTSENKITKKIQVSRKPSIDKHEQMIVKLKSYILKCGKRTNWKVELEGLTPIQSVNKLKNILEDLGIKGRPSLSQCKAIKEQLELKKELEELASSESDQALTVEENSNDQEINDLIVSSKKVSYY